MYQAATWSAEFLFLLAFRVHLDGVYELWVGGCQNPPVDSG